MQQYELTSGQYIIFYLENEAYGLEIKYVQEIIRVPRIVRVPRTPPYLEGLANLRGNILTVVNTSVKFSLEKKPLTETSRVIVLGDNHRRLGFIVDKVYEVVNIAAGEIEEISEGNVQAEFLKGIARLAEDKRLIKVVDADYLMQTKEDQTEDKEQITESSRFTAPEEEKKEEEKIQLVSFKIGTEEFGIDIGMVQEIVHLPEIINKVPNSPDYLLGVMTLRNYVLPVVNLRTIFQLGNKDLDERTRIVVIDLHDQQEEKILAGLVVDSVSEVLRIPKSIIDPVPFLLSLRNGEGITGICKVAEGKRLVYILDPMKFLALNDLLKVGAIDNMKENVTVDTDEQEEQLVTFKLGNEEFAASITEVREIIRVPDIVAVPKAPQFIEGVVNLRGNIIPVIDLRKRFKMEKRFKDEYTRVIVVEIDGLLTGLIVDSVREVIKVSRLGIDKLPELLTSSVDTRFIRGIAKVNGGERLIIILNTKEVLSFEEKEELIDFGQNTEFKEEDTGLDS